MPTCLVHFIFRLVWNKEMLYHHCYSTVLWNACLKHTAHWLIFQGPFIYPFFLACLALRMKVQWSFKSLEILIHEHAVTSPKTSISNNNALWWAEVMTSVSIKILLTISATISFWRILFYGFTVMWTVGKIFKYAAPHLVTFCIQWQIKITFIKH